MTHNNEELEDYKALLKELQSWIYCSSIQSLDLNENKGKALGDIDRVLDKHNNGSK